MKHRRTGTSVSITLALLFVAGCGGDDDGSTMRDDPTENESTNKGPADAETDSAADAADAAAVDGSCAGLSVTGASPGNDSFLATSAAAVSLEGGRAYTMYLADFDLTLDDVSAFGIPTVPDGATMFTIAVTVFNAPDVETLSPIAPGQVIEHSSEWEVLTFVSTVRDGDGVHGNSTGASGTIEVTASGGAFCGSITYDDGEKSLSGTFESPVKSV